MDLKFFVVLLTSILYTDAARILSVVPTLTKSHFIATESILVELANRGHEVVSITPHEIKDAPKTYKWIPVEVTNIFDTMPGVQEELAADLDFIGGQFRLWKFVNLFSKYIVKRPKLKDFIENDNSHFDLVIAEEFFQESFYIFAHKYKAPLVLISTFGNGHFINEYLGNSLELSYVPHEFIDFFDITTFYDKVRNIFLSLADIVLRKYYSLEVQNELAKEIFHNVPNKPHVADLERNASLILLNSHFTMSSVRPYLPNMIEIAGAHIKDIKPLPKDLKDLMDKSRNGVVLFSLGSFLDLASQEEDFTIGVLNSLGTLDYDVIIVWKSDKPLPVKHSNIGHYKWLPQNDLLAHPNMKAFVTHGGLHSALESAYHGVPIVCIPFYGDQKLNCKKSEDKGYGMQLDQANSHRIHEAVNKVTTDRSFKLTAVNLSKRFKDRPLSALENAVFWIEYVIRHKGADFIKSPKRKLSWYQHTCLDVVGFMLAALLVAVLAVRKLFSLVLGKKTNKKVKKN